jgi:hypothetical protein
MFHAAQPTLLHISIFVLIGAMACNDSTKALSLRNGAASSGGTTESRLAKLHGNEEQNLGESNVERRALRN